MWTIGNVILLVIVVPTLVAIINRVLAALERIRAAAADILVGAMALCAEVDTAPDLLATTDRTISEVSDAAVRYAGSVGKLLD